MMTEFLRCCQQWKYPNSHSGIFTNIWCRLIPHTALTWEPSKKEIYQECQLLMQELNPSKSGGMDGVTARLLKDAGDTIIPSLTHIYNLSITKKYFPTDWKLASVSPLFIEGDCNSSNNYRPISLLSIISKISEKIVHEPRVLWQESVWIQKGAPHCHLFPGLPWWHL